MASIIGMLRISLGLETAAFEKGSKRAGAEVDALGTRMEKAGFAVGRLSRTLLAGGAAIAGSAIFQSLRDAAKDGLEYASSLGEVSEQLGVSASALQQYRSIATQVGISQDEIDKGLSTLTRKLGELSVGTDKQRESLAKFGLSQSDVARLMNMNAEQAIPFLADKYRELDSVTEKAAFRAEFFGSKLGSKYATLLSLGAAGIDKMTASWRALGVELTQGEITKADDVLDAQAKRQEEYRQRLAKFALDNGDSIMKAGASWDEFKLKSLAALGAVMQGSDDVGNRIDAPIRAFGVRMRASLREAFLGVVEFQARFKAMPGEIIGYISGMVTRIREWVVTRLGAVWNEAKVKIDQVKGYFFGLYDAVIGHSYIPDMVDGIAAQMRRLDSEMVDKAKSATERTKEKFKKLRDDLRPLLDELFPDDRALLVYQDKLAVLDQGVKDKRIDLATADRGRRGLAGLAATPAEGAVTALPELDELKPKIDGVLEQMGRLKDRAQITSVAVVKSFKDMADETLGALSNLASAIKGGGFLGILDAVLKVGLQLGSIGAFGKTIQTNINAPAGSPSIKGGKARGGSVRERAAYVVGERGPEVFVPGMRGGIIPNSALNDNRPARVQVVPSKYFDVVVDGRIVRASPSIIDGGARVAASRGARAQGRRLA